MQTHEGSFAICTHSGLVCKSQWANNKRPLPEATIELARPTEIKQQQQDESLQRARLSLEPTFTANTGIRSPLLFNSNIASRIELGAEIDLQLK